MRGWASACTDDGFPPADSFGPVGVIVTRDFPEPDFVIEVLQQGIEKHPEMFFVVRDRDYVTGQLLEGAGFADRMVAAPLNPYWRLVGDEVNFDRRREMRDSDIVRWCSAVLLFRKTGSAATDSWLPDKDSWWIRESKVRLFERGSQPKKRHRKGRLVHA